ncbi:hypothetical protein EYV94_08335 [Puteibacter caeruleilacunae]|nr:hypothetical protein EYV94_08335 [Puteibacter caeruleilacunae]
MRLKFLLIPALLISMLTSSCQPRFKKSKLVEIDNAKVIVKGDQIIATTGEATRVWKLTDLGLRTVSFGIDDTSIAKASEPEVEDWRFKWMPQEEKAKLLSVETKKDTDEGFMNEFIRTKATFYYPVSGITLLYDIWTIPGAPGFRTQIWLKKDQDKKLAEFTQGTVELMTVAGVGPDFKAIGYYNDTQHRNTAETPILKEKKFTGIGVHKINWANAVFAASGDKGVVLVKESHKCVNQQGVNTGEFVITPDQLLVTGAGLDSTHINTEFQPCWATWSIAYKGNFDAGKLALKTFDRYRYPIDPNRDIYIMSNTWGSEDAGFNSKYASREENILNEIDVANELGIDLLQIDDGWQGLGYNNWRTVASANYKNNKKGTRQILPNGTAYEVYPEGWRNVRAKAADKGIKLGLWAASHIPYEDLVYNYQQGDFRSYKLDFAKLRTYEILREFETRVRKFVISTNHKVRVNWDVTENPPRIGYYFGREYGNIYLENRKPLQPENVVYHPWLVLRDAWHVAKYTNLNKFQVTYQNVDRVNRKVSDAWKYNHDYCLAATLMGSPIFFQELHLLSDKAKQEIKPLIDVYKSQREAMYAGYVFAIGEEPTNASWSGFQNYNPTTKTGYLTIFRERKNEESEKEIELHFAQNKRIVLTDLMTGETQEQTLGKSGNVTLALDKPGTFLFLKYEMK